GPTAAVIAFHNPHIRTEAIGASGGGTRNTRRYTSPDSGTSREPVRGSDPASASTSATSDCGSQCGGGGEEEGITVPARRPNLFFSTAVSECISDADVVLVAVNTPTKTRGRGAGSATDMAAFEVVTAEVARHARPGAIIVEKSTVPCRTAELVRETLATHRPGVPFEILSNPEFLAAGTAVNDLLHPDRVLIGSDTTPSGRRAAGALAQRVSSINSVSAICERTGADVDEVAAAVGRDPRIGHRFLRAGIGFGGSCFRKDVLGLDEVGEYWAQVVRMNEYQRLRFTRRVVKRLNNTLAGKKITVLGYAFKKDTSDTRESPALEIIRALLEEGPREIAVFDPCCNPLVIREEVRQLRGVQKPFTERGNEEDLEDGPLRVYENAYDACRDSNAVLITTEFDEFRNTKVSLSSSSSSSSSPRKSTADVLDPRPFQSLEIRQADILALQGTQQRTMQLETSSDDPLGRCMPEPECAGDCPDCRAGLDREASGRNTAGSGSETGDYGVSRERIDWARVAGDMENP
ncbi:UDP-glucose 6-dehydrogenase 2, partial [Colletotrichum shisoi]